MPSSEDMLRWSYSKPPVPPDEDETALGELLHEYFSEAYKRFFAEEFEGLPHGTSPLKAMLARQVDRSSNGWGADATWTDEYWAAVPLGVPTRMPNLSPEAMGLLRDALDTTLEHYGTSGDLEPRGFWMKLDVESDQGPDIDAQA